MAWTPAASQAAPATSSDGRWRLEAAPPASLRLLDDGGRQVRDWPAARLDGSSPSAVASVHDNPARRSFLAAFTTLPELWEISYDPAAEPIYDGLVHDWRLGEALPRSGFLGARRTPLEAPLAVLAIAGQGRLVMGLSAGVPPSLDVIHLDVRRRIARTPLAGTPTPQTTALFSREGRELLVVGTGAGGVQVLDPVAGRVLGTLPLGPVLAVRSDPQAPHVAITTAAGPVLLLDKRSLQLAAP